MTSITTLIDANKAKAASTDSAALAEAAKRAQGALQWALAACLWNQAADVLQRDPHTGDETIQAQAHRRAANNCRALVGTNAPMRLLEDSPDYGAMQRERIAEGERQWNREWNGHE